MKKKWLHLDEWYTWFVLHDQEDGPKMVGKYPHQYIEVPEELANELAEAKARMEAVVSRIDELANRV
jgi:hypothetical protein